METLVHRFVHVQWDGFLNFLRGMETDIPVTMIGPEYDLPKLP